MVTRIRTAARARCGRRALRPARRRRIARAGRVGGGAGTGARAGMRAGRGWGAIGRAAIAPAGRPRARSTAEPCRGGPRASGAGVRGRGRGRGLRQPVPYYGDEAREGADHQAGRAEHRQAPELLRARCDLHVQLPQALRPRDAGPRRRPDQRRPGAPLRRLGAGGQLRRRHEEVSGRAAEEAQQDLSRRAGGVHQQGALRARVGAGRAGGPARPRSRNWRRRRHACATDARADSSMAVGARAKGGAPSPAV